MRKIIFTFISLLMVITSCMKRPEVTMHHLLRQVEGMIRTAPDTALYFLEQLGEFNTIAEEDSVYHQLLLLEAGTKNDIKLQDTLAVRSLISYYGAKEDTAMLARSWRLLALAYRDGRYYEETVERYNAAIELAIKIDNKRLLADVYHELAHVHYSQRLFADPESTRIQADSIFRLAELSAIELKDTSLWISSLVSRSLIPRYYQRYTEERDLLLSALDLAVKSGNKGPETTISMFLSLVYAELGEKEKSFAFAKRNLALRKGKIPDFAYCLTLGHAYQRIGIKDSADYYLAKGKELKKKTEIGHSNVSNIFAKEYNDKGISLEQRIQQMRINDSYRQQSIEDRNNYMVSICILVLVLVFVVYQIRKRFLRKETHYREEGEVEKQQLIHEHNQTRKQLQQEQEELKRKNQELALMQNKVALLSTDTGSVFEKINQIADESQYKEDSRLRLEESDWRLLQFEMDKRWNNAISNLQQEYHLTPNEVRLLCLNLLEVPTVRIPYFFERTVGTIYNWNRQLCSKLGIIRNDQLTFKEDFKRFIRNRN